MSIHLRGVDGIESRIREIQSKIDRFNNEFPEKPPLQSKVPGDFQGMIDKSSGNEPFNPMSGEIGLRPIAGGGKAEEFRPMIQQAAKTAGLDPILFEALVDQESSFDPTSVSAAGAQGLTQLMPGTAKMLGVTDPFDPIQSLNGGAKYLSQMMKQFNGDVKLALAAYNAGPGAVKRYNGIPPYKETTDYVQKILHKADILRSK